MKKQRISFLVLMMTLFIMGCDESSEKPRTFYYYPEQESQQLNSTFKLASDYQAGKIIYKFAIYMHHPQKIDLRNTKILLVDERGFQLADVNIHLEYRGWNQPSYYGEGSKDLDSNIYLKIQNFKFYNEVKQQIEEPPTEQIGL